MFATAFSINDLQLDVSCPLKHTYERKEVKFRLSMSGVPGVLVLCVCMSESV